MMVAAGNYPQLMLMGSATANMSSTLENSFIQNAANKSYERLLGETIDAVTNNASSGFQ